jgi:hypothetical protein
VAAQTRYPVISDRVLNRTLLQRQHLLERVTMPALGMVEHLLGLQAQDVLPPYLSLAARLTDPDPHPLSDALTDRRAVRVLLMRGTLHLVTAADAVVLRPWVQRFLDAQARTADFGRGFPVEGHADLVAAAADLLADGPVSGGALGEGLASGRPGLTASRATALAKTLTALVQLPPRGTWGASGGQVYQPLTTWVDRPFADPDPAVLVRRWLRAYGPGTPADVTTWSGVTGIRQVFTALGDELERFEDERGSAVFDLAGLRLADAAEPAPVRLLGVYDNLWLAHRDRTRVTAPEHRRRWAGPNGGMAATVFVDGMLAGLWRRTPSGTVDVELFGSLSRAERAELDTEAARVEHLLAMP